MRLLPALVCGTVTKFQSYDALPTPDKPELRDIRQMHPSNIGIMQTRSFNHWIVEPDIPRFEDTNN